uniref:coiled-coil domain-containing protein 185-like n=1 Tax=Euleptes europaea TaxID=460621 RepID=UPI00254174E5|nr:coiled-coil domain-containing protein 185-like [Euleptes europaea]
MARRRSPGRFSFSPPRGFPDAYSSEPEAAGGEGGPREPRKPPRAASARPRRPAPAGEGGATPSCTTLDGGEAPGKLLRLLRDEPWASPVGYGADGPSDASRPPSLCPSAFSFSQPDGPPPKGRQREPPRPTWPEPRDSCPSLADLVPLQARPCEDSDAPTAYLALDPRGQPRRQAYRQHQQAHRGDAHLGLRDLDEDFLPERDQKIAALMLARHREEEARRDRQRQAAEAWEKMRRKERKHKARLEKEKQCQLAESLDQWHRHRDQRKSKLRLEEQQLLVAREKELMLRDKRWKKMAKEQESRRRTRLDGNKLQADYKKHCQERQLWDRRLSERNVKEHASNSYKDQMLQALERRLMKEMERKRKRADVNQYKKARHVRAKEQADDRGKAEELYKRLCIEQKLQRSQEILEQLIEERNRELKEKSLKEEEQGLIAKVRTKETEEEKRRRKEMLLQIAEMKIQQAKEIMTKNIQDRAQRAREINCMKERNHHCRKQKLDDDEKCHLREIQEAIRRKDQKSNQILRDKEAAIEESRRIAKASYDLREKVRDLIKHGSFDQIAFDAHRNVSLLRGL